MGVRYALVPTLVRGLDYYTRTTFEFIGPLENQNSTITGGGRYDYLVEEIGARRRRGSASAPASSGCSSPWRRKVSGAAPEPAIDVFVALDDRRAARRTGAWLAELRRAGVAAETDYAGRSLKGQLTQARRSADAVVVVGAEGATLRLPGQPDEEVGHDEIVSRLSP